MIIFNNAYIDVYQLDQYPALTNSVVVRHASVDVVNYFFEPLNNEKSFPNNVLLLSLAYSIGLASAILRRSISDMLFFTFKNDSGPAVNL